MTQLRELATLANERFNAYVRDLDGQTPVHRVEFSRRITTSWALLYYRRHLVRLSPYLFLLEPHELKYESHWKELDATLRHEAAHAVHYARTGETGHTAGFHALLEKLGVRPNGCCDLGPENAAFRYVYACPSCHATWPRRAPLKGRWSCGHCSAGRFDARCKLILVATMDPWSRLGARANWVAATLAEAQGANPELPSPMRVVAAAAVAL